MKIMYNNKRKGFIAFVVMFMLVIFALMGIAYWASSRASTDTLYMESQRLKARNYAQAGIEKVKLNMCNMCQRTNKFDMRMSSSQKNKMSKEFEDGGYRIVSIQPFAEGNTEFKNVKHIVKGRVIGEFDVWEVVVEGYTTKTKTCVEIKHIIRIYRDNIVY